MHYLYVVNSCTPPPAGPLPIFLSSPPLLFTYGRFTRLFQVTTSKGSSCRIGAFSTGCSSLSSRHLPPNLDHSFLCRGECPIEMILRLSHTASPITRGPTNRGTIWFRHRRTVSDISTTPAYGNTVCDQESKANKGDSGQVGTKTNAMDIGHHKIPVCSLYRNLFPSQTVTLRGIIEVNMRRAFQVDSVSNLLSTLTIQTNRADDKPKLAETRSTPNNNNCKPPNDSKAQSPQRWTNYY